MRRVISLLLGLTFAAALASCGGGSSSTSTSTSTQGQGAKPSPPATRRCLTSSLRVHPVRGGAAAGNARRGFEILNRDRKPCTLSGFPSVVLLDASAKPIGIEVKPASSDYFGTVPARAVTLPASGVASFRIADHSGAFIGSQHCLEAARIRVSFPPDDEPIDVPLKATFCPTGKPTVSPVAPGHSAAS
jgi:Domain of unknown function (DUF4232)